MLDRMIFMPFNNFSCQFFVRPRALAFGIIVRDGLAKARRFRQTNGSRNNGTENTVREIFVQLMHNFFGEPGTFVKHGNHRAQYG